jgi:hypothetical protein
VVAAVGEDVEEHREDALLGLGIGPAREATERVGHGGDLALGLLPRREDGQEDVVASARHVAPARRALVVHGHRVAVDPDHVQREVAHQLVAGLVVARLDALEDVGAGRRLGLEVAGDDRVELLEAVEDGEVQLGQEVRREHEPPVAVDDERLHGSGLPARRPPSRPVSGREGGRRPGAQAAAGA